MHELSVCLGMLQQVEDIARDKAATEVVRIRIQIGPLSGVEANLLEQAFPLASAGTLAEHAELIIDPLPVRVRCRSCSSESDVPPNRLLCTHCGAYDTQIISGDELLLSSVELVCQEEDSGQPLASPTRH